MVVFRIRRIIRERAIVVMAAPAPNGYSSTLLTRNNLHSPLPDVTQCIVEAEAQLSKVTTS